MKLDDMIEVIHVCFDDIPLDDLNPTQINWIKSHQSTIEKEREKFENFCEKMNDDPRVIEHCSDGSGFSSSDIYWDYVKKIAKKYAR